MDKGDKEENMFKFDTNDDLSPSPRDSPMDKKPRNDNPQNTMTSHTESSQSNLSQPLMVAASPPKFVSMSEVMAAADGVGNMVLAHEIAVDPDFKFTPDQVPAGTSSLEQRVNEMMRKAFWDILQEKLDQDPPDFSHAIALLKEVKESLLGILLPQHKRLKEEVEEVLDLQLIQQQVQQGALDFHHYSGFVIGMMARLCAPARDDQVTKLKDINDIVPLYKGIFEMLDLLKRDLANYTIQHVRPYLQQESITYERTKFADFLKKQQGTGVDGLECTKSWIERSVLRLAEKEQEKQEGASAANPQPTYSDVMNKAFIELLEWPENLLFPETLLMDQGRFAVLEKKCHWLSLVTSVLLVTYNTVGAPIAGVAGLKQLLMQQITALLKGVTESGLEDAMVGVAEQVNKEVGVCLEKHGYKPLDASRQDMLKNQIQAVRSQDHVVHKLMKSRLEGFLIDLLAHADKPAETRLPPGYTAVAKELSHVSGQFLRLVSYNQKVFSQYYADIVKDVLTKQRQAEGTPV